MKNESYIEICKKCALYFDGLRCNACRNCRIFDKVNKISKFRLKKGD